MTLDGFLLARLPEDWGKALDAVLYALERHYGSRTMNNDPLWTEEMVAMLLAPARSITEPEPWGDRQLAWTMATYYEDHPEFDPLSWED